MSRSHHHLSFCKQAFQATEMFFDGYCSSADWGRVKAAQSAPAGHGLDPDTSQDNIHQSKNAVVVTAHRRTDLQCCHDSKMKPAPIWQQQEKPGLPRSFLQTQNNHPEKLKPDGLLPDNFPNRIIWFRLCPFQTAYSTPVLAHR